MSFTSYAQAGEDILLWRALAGRVHHDHGFYIDVGGYDPDHDSVTRAFYDSGWRGVNVEPVRAFHEAFVRRRPRDINIQAAVSDHTGTATFHEVVGEQLGTMVDQYAANYAHHGKETRTYEVDALTLADICDRHVGDRPIHFLKIDVEGHEGAALRGMDFKRWRPWVLVVEATEPNRHDILTHAEWDKYVRWRGYHYVGTTLPNRYYVAREHLELARYFKVAPDIYERGSLVARAQALEVEVERLQGELAQAQRWSAMATASHRTTSTATGDRGMFVGCATDKRFVGPTAVMLASLDANGDIPDAEVVVAGFGLDETDLQTLKAGAGRLSERLRLLEVDRRMLEDVAADLFSEAWPPATLGRLLIADHLVGESGRLLTLDSDMVVNASVRPLFELDLGDTFFAAVHDWPSSDPDYFNAGLTLCELEPFRQEAVGPRCLRYLATTQARFIDQDALNHVIGARWTRLDASWNTHGRLSTAEFEGAKIAHFAAKPKPWDQATHAGRPLYNRYLARLRRAQAGGVEVEAQAQDFLAAAYEVLLGRELETLAVARDRKGLSTAEALAGVMTSAEFVDNVAAPLRSGEPFPHGRFPGQPSLRQRLWASHHFARDRADEGVLQACLTWRDLLSAVVDRSGRAPAEITPVEAA